MVGGAIYTRHFRIFFFAVAERRTRWMIGVGLTACETPKLRYVPDGGGGGGVRCCRARGRVDEGRVELGVEITLEIDASRRARLAGVKDL